MAGRGVGTHWGALRLKGAAVAKVLSGRPLIHSYRPSDWRKAERDPRAQQAGLRSSGRCCPEEGGLVFRRKKSTPT